MALDTSEIKKIIIDLESRYPVDTWVIKDLHIWFLYRIRLYFSLFLYGRYDKTPSRHRERLIRIIRTVIQKCFAFFNYLYAFLSDCRQNDSCKGQVDYLFLTYTFHRTAVNGKWFDRFCDPMIDALRSMNKTSLLLELSSNGEYRVPRHSKSVFIQPSVDLIRLKNHVFKRKLFTSEVLAGFAELGAFLQSKKYIESIPTAGDLRKEVNALLDLSRYFSKVLERVRPTIVFIAQYYSLCGIAMILACKRMRIITVDIQHGATNEEHVAYGCWTRLPVQGYEMFPSVFWCWRNEDAKVIEQWNRKTPNPISTYVGGNPWLTSWKDGESELVKSYDEQIAHMKSKTGATTFILFTPSLVSDIKDWILQSIKSSPPTYHWWIRLHPCMSSSQKSIKKKLKSMNITSFEMDKATLLPLPALLRHASVNITAFSSTVVEADEYGVPSILTDPKGVSLFTNQIRSGTAILASTQEELVIAIEKQIDRKAHGLHSPTNQSKKIRDTMNTFISLYDSNRG